jgi:cytochrome c-type biogenesis protein CcmE
MATNKTQRILFFVLTALSLGGALTLILTSLQKSMVYFYAPHEVSLETKQSQQILRIGGLVLKGSYSVTGQKNSVNHHFVITDYKENLDVYFEGMVPDLFREGQGVIAEGRFNKEGIFIANKLLVKHDETYMPPEVMKKENAYRKEAL